MGIQSVSQPGSGASLTGTAAPQAQAAPVVVSSEPVAQAVTTQPQAPDLAEQSANLEQALKQLQDMVQSKANNLQFSVDDTTGKTVVRVIDSSNGSTIRQIPSEEALAIAQDIERMKGLLLRDSA